MSDTAVLSLFAASLFTGGLVLLAHELSPRFALLHIPIATANSYGVPVSPVLRLVLAPFLLLFLLPAIGTALGRYFTSGTATRRQQLISRTESEKRALGGHQPFDEKWEEREEEETKRRNDPKIRAAEYAGLVGFFHPFCNAGGGGERVLWAAIRATQLKYPKAICVVYTGDHDATKEEMVKRAATRFNIEVNEPHVHFLYLSTRKLVLASTWPHFTLLGQSIGSMILLLDAFTMLVPDMFIDTMGYGFSLAVAKWLKLNLPTGAYVHYPTISTDMLATLDDESTAAKDGTGIVDGPREGADTSDMVGRRGLNAGSGRGLKGTVKRYYWQLFAWMYSWAGGSVDVVMTNSTWTQGHVRSLWGASRARQGRTSEIEVNFPPCAVGELEAAVEVSEKSETRRENVLLYIAQFRPEKNHELVLHAFSKLLDDEAATSSVKNSRLVLVGSVRDDEDSKRVYKLRLLANELRVNKQVEFVCNASWTDILGWLRRSSVGINGMWNEHFGIGVVEYQAAGLISVVNNSGGPKLDIVTEVDGKPTGFHASTVAEYADGFRRSLEMSREEAIDTRKRARISAKRFTEEEFDHKWLIQLERLIQLDVYPRTQPVRPIDFLISGLLAVAVFDDLNSLFGPYVKELAVQYM